MSAESDGPGRAPPPGSRDPFADAVARLGPALLGAVAALEQTWRRLDPPALPQLRQALGPVAEALDAAADVLGDAPAEGAVAELADRLGEAARLAREALAGVLEPAPPDRAVPRLLEAMLAHARAQEVLYPLRRVLPPVSRFFLEPAARAHAAGLDPDRPARSDVGVRHARGRENGRGGFSLYVPESLGAEPRPLVTALHGAGGHGRAFLWTWLRECRSRRCLLLAPTSLGDTWSLHGPDVDGPELRRMLAWVEERYPVDPGRRLLTGLSDGATFTLLCGLAEDAPWTALAPFSGVLHPANFGRGNLERAAGRPVYQVHGARDWLFPVTLAREAARLLREAGAELVFRELEDLSHTYAREENAAVLDWLGAAREDAAPAD